MTFSFITSSIYLVRCFGGLSLPVLQTMNSFGDFLFSSWIHLVYSAVSFEKFAMTSTVLYFYAS